MWINHNHFVGDAKPKNIEDIEDWGDISEDSDYREKFKEYGSQWSKKRGQSTAIFELEDNSEIPWGHDQVDGDSIYITKSIERFLK